MTYNAKYCEQRKAKRHALLRGELQLTPKQRERFWAKAKVAGPDECWEWTACLDKDGYGMFLSMRASRLAWLMAGNMPPGELFVLHTCDNPACVNARHLFLGTPLDNMRDKIAKGRGTRGTKVKGARLDPDKVRAIRSALAGGTTQEDLAAQYGVEQTTISSIKRGRVWAWVA